MTKLTAVEGHLQKGQLRVCLTVSEKITLGACAAPSDPVVHGLVVREKGQRLGKTAEPSSPTRSTS